MVDVKKLITGFLIIGSAATGSGLILATVGDTISSPTTQTSPQIAIQGVPAQSLPVGGNAFLPQPTAQDDTQIIGYPAASSTSSSPRPGNLTDALADAFMNGVVSANPSGPQNDESGNPVIANPDAQAVAMAVASSTAVNNLRIPDWDLEANAQSIRAANSATPMDVSGYSDALNSIVNRRFVSTGLVSMVNSQSPDSSRVGDIQSQVQGALSDTLALQAPASLVNLQKSLVKVLVYEKNVLTLLQNANDDPVKTSLILSREENKYNDAIQNLRTEMQKAAAVQGFSFGTTPGVTKNRAVALFDAILGIKTANAQWLTFDAANFGEWLYNFAKDIALQILKNILIAFIQRKVLTWVQGAGMPRFITGWATTFINAYTQTALSAINSQMACVYPFFAPQLRLTLASFYKPASNNVCANTFQNALAGHTFRQFYNNFQNGGWVAYGASMLPSGNYYGGLAFQAQVVDQTAHNQKQATISKSTGNQGLKGDQVCADGSNPNGTHTECLDQNDIAYYPNPDGSCDPGFFPAAKSNGGLCANGREPIVTTPGTFTGFGVGSALDSSPKLITAANDIVGLLNALMASLLNSLADMAINAATDAVNSGLNGGISSVPPSSIQGGGTSTAPTIALTCNPLTQIASTTFPINIGAVGGKSDVNGNPPVYSWRASNGATSAGPLFSTSFALPGAYTVTLTDSTGDSPATCRVTAQ